MEIPPDDLRPGRRLKFVWVGYWVVLFVLTHIPVEPRVPGMRHGDKILHVVAYFVLTFLGGWAASQRMRASRLLGWAIVYAAYAAADEYLQRFAGRSMTLGDFLADLLGIALATAVLAANRREKTTSEAAEA